MSAFDSECSSGCESGWTLYLEHSFGGGYYGEHKDKIVTNDYSEGVEDLSMISDASSGPPQYLPFDDDANYFNQKNNACFYSESNLVKQNKSASKKQNVRDKNKQQLQVEDQQHLPSFLHDTASSHVFDFSTNNDVGTNQQTYKESMVDYSQGFSATNYFEGRSSYQEQQHFGYLQPSLSKNEIQGNKWYGGKGMGMRERRC